MRYLLALLLPAFAVAAPAKHSWTTSKRELRLGLLAHIDGKDKLALKHFAACLKLAAPRSPDADSCSIYADMFGAGKAKSDGASKPEARKKFKAGVAAYKAGNLVAADKRWHECIDLSEVATAVRNDCLAAVDLIPETLPKPEEMGARAVYMDGLDAYLHGDDKAAAEAWVRCAKEAPRGSDTEADCRAGLEKLGALQRAR